MRGGRGLIGAVAGVMGVGFVARALHGTAPSRDAAGAPLRRLRASVRVGRPIEECFAAWAEPANLPRFLSHLRAARALDDARLLFTVDVAGRDLELDAMLTRFEPPRTIAWRTLGTAPLAHSALVTFAREGRGTTVSAHFTYAMPAHQLRDLVADALGARPQGRLERDLDRMKVLLEAPAR